MPLLEKNGFEGATKKSDIFMENNVGIRVAKSSRFIRLQLMTPIQAKRTIELQIPTRLHSDKMFDSDSSVSRQLNPTHDFDSHHRNYSTPIPYFD